MTYIFNQYQFEMSNQSIQLISGKTQLSKLKALFLKTYVFQTNSTNRLVTYEYVLVQF